MQTKPRSQEMGAPGSNAKIQSLGTLTRVVIEKDTKDGLKPKGDTGKVSHHMSNDFIIVTCDQLGRNISTSLKNLTVTEVPA